MLTLCVQQKLRQHKYKKLIIKYYQFLMFKYLHSKKKKKKKKIINLNIYIHQIKKKYIFLTRNMDIFNTQLKIFSSLI